VAFFNNFGLNDSESTMDCWDKRPHTISSTNWKLLESIYLHPHHIDLVVGGFAEESYNGGVVGQTFGQIIGKQFKALRFGDRFFFTHQGNMNDQELEQVRKRTLGDIICENTMIDRVRENAFRADTPFRNCPGEAAGMDISKFRVFRASDFRSLAAHCWDDRIIVNGIPVRYDNVTAAQVACSSDPNCGGVYDRHCQGNELYLCQLDAIYQPSNTSCIMEKQHPGLEQMFTKISSAYCHGSFMYGDSFRSMTAARVACSRDSNCQGIYNKFCNGSEIRLCSLTGTYTHYSGASCIYDKNDTTKNPVQSTTLPPYLNP